MKQLEMSKYLKAITLGIGILFFIFVVWFLPSVGKQLIWISGADVYWGVCTLLWVTSIPCFLCLWKFWGICDRIGKDESFSRQNAKALKQMSHYLLADCVIYTLFLVVVGIGKWYLDYGVILLFGILFLIAVGISLTVLCASLSHLVYKASVLQEEQNLTI